MIDKAPGAGCAVAMAALNCLLMGFVASGFAFGPYSSWEQEVWYRYGSIGFLLCGAILPAVALALGARRFEGANIALTLWMILALCAFLTYGFLSGGGV